LAQQSSDNASLPVGTETIVLFSFSGAIVSWTPDRDYLVIEALANGTTATRAARLTFDPSATAVGLADTVDFSSVVYCPTGSAQRRLSVVLHRGTTVRMTPSGTNTALVLTVIPQ
jgi:hypothetical protein